jgi:hypothetical protein
MDQQITILSVRRKDALVHDPPASVNQKSALLKCRFLFFGEDFLELELVLELENAGLRVIADRRKACDTHWLVARHAFEDYKYDVVAAPPRYEICGLSFSGSGRFPRTKREILDDQFQPNMLQRSPQELRE